MNQSFIFISIIVSVLWIPFSILCFKKEASKGRLCYSLLPSFIINPIIAFNVALALIYAINQLLQ